MFHDVNGDLLLSRAQLIVQGVAPNDDFHAGLALALRERYPALYKDFRHWCHVHHPKPGELFVWSGPGLRVANLLTQEPPLGVGEHPGKARLEYVHRALRALAKFVVKERIASVAVPKLATGVGGLGWADVNAELRRAFEHVDAEVYVYTVFRAGMTAVEPGLPSGVTNREARA